MEAATTPDVLGGSSRLGRRRKDVLLEVAQRVVMSADVEWSALGLTGAALFEGLGGKVPIGLVEAAWSG